MAGLRVVDSWALVAWLLDQPAATRVDRLLQQAEQGGELQILMSWVNVGEVYYIASRKLGSAMAEEFFEAFAVTADSPGSSKRRRS